MNVKFINARILGEVDLKQLYIKGNIIHKISNIIQEPADRVIDLKGKLLMSGFVNAHCHNPMTLLRGIKDDVNLQTWLFDYMFPNEAKLSEEDLYYGELLGIAESIRSGITCIEENYFSCQGNIEAIKKSKIRARFGITTERESDDFVKDFDECLISLKDSNLIVPSIFIHSIYTTSEQEIMEQTAYAKAHNLPVSIHLSETLEEVGECMTKHNQTPVEYLESLGFFDRPATAYHCVHMDKDDVKILADYNVNVVTCPSSNLKLGSGIAPVHTFLENGINVALGTDGPASNNSLDMFKEMYLCSCLQKAHFYDSSVVSASQTLKIATENGAKMMGFKSGIIKEGYLADLIVVDINKLHYYPCDNMESNLVYAGRADDVVLTMVNGEILYENGKFNLGFDLDYVIKKCFEIRKRLEK